MSDYYYVNQTVHLPSTKQEFNTAMLFETHAVTSRLSALPPAPFLVPAVLESLLMSSQYKGITSVVPGEADLYCSQYLSLHGGVVLTGDSDLLVHDLGESGKVAFFRDLRVQGGNAQSLQSKVYWPSSIAHRLSMPPSHNLTSLAFEMSIDSHIGFKQLVSRARELQSVKNFAPLFEQFCQDYRTLVSELPSSNDADSALSVLQSVDPRISEYMLQFPSIATLAGCTHERSSLTLTHIFLPFLVDSPTRTSAWEASTPVRVVAFSVLNLVVPDAERKTIVYEHKKQTDKSQGRSLLLLSNEDLPKACSNLTVQISLLRSRLSSQLCNRDFWTAFAVSQDIDFANTNLKTATIKLVRQQMSSNKLGKTSSWDVIQLFAQIQASFYSFRMLKQMLAFVVASAKSLPKPVIQLKEELTTLSTIAHLQDLSQMSDTLQTLDECRVYEIACDILGIVVDAPEITEKKKAKLAKKKKKREQAAAVQVHTKSNNPYALLGID